MDRSLHTAALKAEPRPVCFPFGVSTHRGADDRVGMRAGPGDAGSTLGGGERGRPLVRVGCAVQRAQTRVPPSLTSPAP